MRETAGIGCRLHSPKEELLEQRYPAGTMLSCPFEACGFGLYRIVEPATLEDLVVFDDKVLVPFNNTIPPLDVWQMLACPLCGSRVLKDGKVHTVQQGWR